MCPKKVKPSVLIVDGVIFFLAGLYLRGVGALWGVHADIDDRVPSTAITPKRARASFARAAQRMYDQPEEVCERTIYYPPFVFLCFVVVPPSTPPLADRNKRKLFEGAPGYVQGEKDRAAQKREEAAARRRAQSEERSEERAALEDGAGSVVGSTSESEVRRERGEGEAKDGGCSPGPDMGVSRAGSAVGGGGGGEASGGDVSSPVQPSPVAAMGLVVGQGLNHAARASCDGGGGGHGGDARIADAVDAHYRAHLALVTPPSTASSAAESSSPETPAVLPSLSPPQAPLASLEPIRNAQSAGGGRGAGGGGRGSGGGDGGGGSGGGSGGGVGRSHRPSPGSATDMEDGVIAAADALAVADGGDDSTARLPSTAFRDWRRTHLTVGGVGSSGSPVRGGGFPVHGRGGCSGRKAREAPPEGTGMAVLGRACGVADIGIGGGGGDVGGVRLGGDGVDCGRETGVRAGGGLRDSHGERAEEDAERADDDCLVSGGLSAMDVVLTQEQEEAETYTMMYGE